MVIMAGRSTGSLGLMPSISVRIEQDGQEKQEHCSCCGRSIFLGRGVLASAENDLADYWYRWPEGHGKQFTLAISPCNVRDEPTGGVAVISGRLENENLVYSVVEPENSPWPDSNIFGQILSRKAVLEGPLGSEVFALVDAITANEPRLSSRILKEWHEA
jgi:hypothetical protein